MKSFKFFEDLQDFGLVLVDGMPENRDSLRDLMKRVGCIRSTHYGDIFHVVTKPNPNNLAYLPVTLGLHIDLPYYGYNPGVNAIYYWVLSPILSNKIETVCHLLANYISDSILTLYRPKWSYWWRK